MFTEKAAFARGIVESNISDSTLNKSRNLKSLFKLAN